MVLRHLCTARRDGAQATNTQSEENFIMDSGLNGKVVVITGGGSGIGKASAYAFLKEGCKVAICGWIPEELEQTRREFHEEGYDIVTSVTDVRKFDELNDFADKVIGEYGRIDVWVNNAGIMPISGLLDMSEEEWDKAFSINVKAIFLGSKIAAGHMIKSGGGVILNAASIASNQTPDDAGAYATTKAAVPVLTQAFAAELAPFNIRVVAYKPGLTNTGLFNNNSFMADGLKTKRDEILLNRIAEPKDIANVVVFLASDLASYVTATQLEVSGGKFTAQHPHYYWEKFGR